MANLGQMLMQGPNSGSYTPETLDRRRQMAQAMLKGGSGIQDIRHPLQGLAQMLQAGIGGYQSRMADEEEATQRSAANERLAALLSGGVDAPMEELVSAAGDPWADDAHQQLAMMLMGEQMERGRPKEPSWQYFESGGDRYRFNESDPNSTPEMFFDGPDAAPEIPDAVQALDLRAQRAGLVPGTPEYNDFMITGGGKGQTINVGGNNDIGTIPPGMMVTRDEAGNVTGMQPIPGGPAEAEILAANERENAADSQAATYGNVVTEDIDRAINLLKEDPTFTTGPFGQLLGNISGTSANRLDSLLSTVRANTSFDRLQAMRAASPTGGALGAVSDTELRLLQNSIGALERSNPDDLEYNLRRVQQIYNNIVNGPETGTQNAVQTQSAPKAPSVGLIEDGYRFKGGDPADPNSWEKVQ